MSKNILEKKIAEIRSYPQLFLFDYFKDNGASVYAGFIQAILGQDQYIRLPQEIKIILQGDYHFIYADGCYLDLEKTTYRHIPLDYGSYNGLVGWLMGNNLKTARDSQDFLFDFETLGLVIYSTEFCAVDITTELEHFRQFFYQGQAITPCERRVVDRFPPNAPFIGLQFTLGSPIFDSRTISLKQVKSMLEKLWVYELVPEKLKIKKSKPTDYGFEMVLQIGQVHSE